MDALNARLVTVLGAIFDNWGLRGGRLVLCKSNYEIVAAVSATTSPKGDDEDATGQAYTYSLEIKPDSLQLVKSLNALHLAGSRFGKYLPLMFFFRRLNS
jgi:hypothetical protein